jgi:two-component system, chemotaxis family, protein-glutamate methylesterase/glutaminase
LPGDQNGTGHDVVVVGASAGGIEALKELVAGLPSDLRAALFIVLHLPTGGTSVLPAILTRAGPLPAEHVNGGVEIERGRIYVAPPDLHLRFDDGRVEAVAGPRENGHRPAIDPLFRSAAHTFGPRAVGVILSGTLDDGTLGLRAIKTHGGATLVQDPATAQHDGMPRSAIAYADPDEIASPTELARLIVQLANDPLDDPNGGAGAEMNEHSEDVARQTDSVPQPGEKTGLTCPECGGAIWIEDNGDVPSYACRVDHKYTVETFAVEQGRTVEAAVWSALRLIEERVVLMRSLADRFKDQRRTSRNFAAKADDLEQHASTLLSMVESVARAVAVPAQSDA